MNSTTRNVLIGIVALIVIILLGYFAWQERQNTLAPESAVSTSTPSITISSSTAATSSPGYTMTEIPIGTSSAPVAPNYKTPLSFSSSVSSDEQTAMQSQFATIQTTLASDPTDYGSWIDLGILREEAGDYAGAAADWKYVTELYPTDAVSLADLGDLYANYLNQPSQGIAYYKQSIALDPTQESSYQDLAQIYINEGDAADAKAVLEQGISAQVSGYQNLQTMLQSIQG